MLQTTSVEAQDIERQIQRVWAIFRQNPDAHRNARPLTSRLNDIAAEISQRALPFDEWQVVYRQALQLARALSDEPQLIERTLGEQEAVALPTPDADGTQHRQVPTWVLVSRAVEIGARLISIEVELARAEVKADLAAEIGSAKMLAGAAVGLLLSVNVMLLAALAVLAMWLPSWVVASAFGVLLVGAGGLVAYAGWKRRVEAPLKTTRSSLTEDVRWVKRRIA
jgi:hypothetical protein